MRLEPYTDTVGKITIGVGRNLTDVGISQNEAMAMLRSDQKSAENGVLHRWQWSRNLDDRRLAVMVNMAFNMGIEGLAEFQRMLAAVEAGDYDIAAMEMLDSVWATQVGDRATRLAEQMRTGKWV
jgi:lysozyme